MAAGTQVVMDQGHRLTITNSSTADDDVLITTPDLSRFDTFHIHATAGSVDVFGSLDGTNFTTSALSLTDQSATTSDPVVVAAAGKMYGLVGCYAKLRVMQNGATNPTSVTLMCGKRGSS
jgi:hypothetical protein